MTDLITWHRPTVTYAGLVIAASEDDTPTDCHWCGSTDDVRHLDGFAWCADCARNGRRPHVNLSPPGGRNDPCPCGSGKKRKRCHRR